MRRYAGITVQTQRVVIRAPGTIAAPACAPDPTDCCADPVPEAGCCPEGVDPSATVALYLTAPVGAGGAEVTFSGDLEYTDSGVWRTTDPITGADGLGAAATSLEATLYCDPVSGVWQIDATVTDFTGAARAFAGELEEADEVLYAVLVLVGAETEMLLVVEHPCDDGEPSLLECVDKPLTCGPCETPQISSRFSLRDETDIELDKLALIAGGGCQFLSVFSVGEWKLEYLGDDLWRLTNLDGRTWETDAWSCCETNTMVSQGEWPDYTLVPLFDCCPPEPRYNCTDGECIESAEGTYASLGLCQAACAPVVPCCDGTIPDTFYIHFTGTGGPFDVSGVSATFTKTGPTVWQMSPGSQVGSTSGCTGLSLTSMYFDCSEDPEITNLQVVFGTDYGFGALYGSGFGQLQLTGCSPFTAVISTNLLPSFYDLFCGASTCSAVLNTTPP